MADSNKYIDMSAKEALKLAKDKYLLLPDIQMAIQQDLASFGKPIKKH